MLVKHFVPNNTVSISTGCYFAKKLILWLQDQNTLIERSHISIMTMGINLSPAPNIEKSGWETSLIWSNI